MEQSWTWAQFGWALLEWLKVLVDLLKAYAWPLAAFAIVWLFRKQIRALLPLTRKAGPGGFEFDAQPQPNERRREETQLELFEHHWKTVNSLMGNIKEEVTKLPEDRKQLALIASLAQARVEANFEFIFGVIFQSQIDALKLLRSEPLALTEARKRYEGTYPEISAALSFDDWSRFLINQGLVLIQDDMVKITDLGKDFLVFVEQKKAGIPRPN